MALAAANAAESGAGSSGETRLAVGGTDEGVAAGDPAASSETRPRIAHGRVVDERGDGIACARVVLQADEVGGREVLVGGEILPSMRDWLQVRETVTDGAGHYAFDDPKGGRFAIAAYSSEHAPGVVRGQIVPQTPKRRAGQTDAEPPPDVELETIVVRSGALLTGTVVGADGAPIAAARLLRSQGQLVPAGTVLLPGLGVPLGETSADGSFRLANLEPGPLALLVVAPGHLPLERTCEALPRDRPARPLRLVLHRGAEIRGRVVGHSPQAVASMSIVARQIAREGEDRGDGLLAPTAYRPSTAPCDESGAFVLGEIEAGRRYRLTVYEPDPEAKVPTGAPPPVRRSSEYAAVYAEAGEENVEIRLRSPATLRFRALDAVSGAPITTFETAAGWGGTNWLTREGRIVREHEGGRVEFVGLLRHDDQARPELLVRAPGYEHLEKTDFDFAPGEDLDLGDVLLQPTGSLDVQVLGRGADGALEPLPGARVVVAHGEARKWTAWLVRADEVTFRRDEFALAETGADGHALVSLVAGQRVELLCAAEGYVKSEPREVLLPASGRTEVTIELAQGARARVLVQDHAGMPQAGIAVLQRPLTTSSAEDWIDVDELPRSDAQGVVYFDGLGPGGHAFRTVDGDGWMQLGEGEDLRLSPWVSAHLAAGTEVDVVLVGPKLAGLSGVVRELGTPLERAALRLQSNEAAEDDDVEGESYETTTQPDGSYRFENVPLGVYRLLVSHTSQRMAQIFDVVVRAEDERFDVDLTVASIEGRVFDDAGAPVEGASIGVRDEESLGESFAWGGQAVITSDEEGDVDWNERNDVEPENVSDVAGRWILRGVMPNVKLVVSVRHPWLVRDHRELEPLSEHEVRQPIDFHLERAGQCTVEIAAAAADQQRYTIELSRAKDAAGGTRRERGSVSRWNRRRTFASLLPGNWTVSVHSGRGRELTKLAETQVEIVAGRTAEVTLRVP